MSLLEIETDTNQNLRPQIEAVARPCDDVIFDLSNDGVDLTGIDTHKTVLSAATLDAGGFDMYTAQDATVAVDASALQSAIRTVNKTDPVGLTITEAADSSDIATLTITDSSSDQTEKIESRTDSIPSLPEMPSVSWTTAITVPGDELKRAIRAGQKVGTAAHIQTTEDNSELLLYVEGDSDEVYAYPSSTNHVSSTPSEPTEGNYSIDFLRAMSLGIDRPASTDVTVHLAGQDKPLRWTFDITAAHNTTVTYVVAPKVLTGDDTLSPNLTFERGTAHVAPKVRATADGHRARKFFGRAGVEVDEYRMLATPDGIETRAIDSASVIMSGTVAEPGYFDEYVCNESLRGLPIGIHDTVADYLKLWRKRDQFTLRADPESQWLEFEHEFIHFRIDILDSDAIRAGPEFPPIDASGRATVNVDEFTAAIDTISSISDHGAIGIDGDTTCLFANDSSSASNADDSPGTKVTQITTDEESGRAFSIFSADYLSSIADTIANTESEVATITAGIELPVSISVTGHNRTLSSQVVLAPRILTESESALTDAVLTAAEAQNLNFSWITDDPTVDDVYPLHDSNIFPAEPISKRAEEYQYSVHPITTAARLRRTDGPKIVLDNQDMLGVDDATITSALEEIKADCPIEALESREKVASVTFTSSKSYEIDWKPLQSAALDTEYRITTADGVRLSKGKSESDYHSYQTRHRDTPARAESITVGATGTDASDPEYQLHITAVGSDSISAAKTVESGFDSMAHAYIALREYIETHTVDELVEAVNLTPDYSITELQDALTDLVDDTARWSATAVHGSDSFAAVLEATGDLLPDATWSAQVIVDQPDATTDPFPVRYVIDMTAHGPGTAGTTEELISGEIGMAETRAELPNLLEAGLDRIAQCGSWFYSPSEQTLTPPALSSSAPWVDAYYPISRAELRAQICVDGPDIPVELTDIDRIGPSRAETLSPDKSADIFDMLPYIGTHRDKSSKTGYNELPTAAQQNVQSVLETLWKSYVWPQRSIPGTYDDAATSVSHSSPPDTEHATKPDLTLNTISADSSGEANVSTDLQSASVASHLGDTDTTSREESHD